MPEGRDLCIPTSARANQRALKNGGQDTHILANKSAILIILAMFHKCKCLDTSNWSGPHSKEKVYFEGAFLAPPIQTCKCSMDGFRT